MKIFSANQIYEADKFTIAEQQISSDLLMERAAERIFDWIHRRMQGAQVKIHLFCGIGNNGGDGMALARMLFENGYNFDAYVVNYSDKRSPDFLTNLSRLKERKVWPNFLESAASLPEIGVDDIIVDAIFGIGLNRAPDPWVGELITHLNASRAFILSIDIPSGLFMDRVPEHPDRVINANYVLSFQAPKLPFFLPQTGVYLNQWEVLDIGLSPTYLGNTQTDFGLIGRHEVLPLYRPRYKFTHKGTYGHSLIIGGSYGKMGAVQLAANACLNVGSGLVTALVPECGCLPLQTALPEIMVQVDDGDDQLSEIDVDGDFKAVGIGIGMGTEATTLKAFKGFLKKVGAPLVIDADALNLLAQDKSLLEALPEHAILTPHPKEFERLVGAWKDDFEKVAKAAEFSKTHKVVLVLKGAHTLVFANGIGHINTSGNPGMATAGSGDVLTGMITGLLAQGYEALAAAVFGVFLHGLSGDIAATEHGYEALTATRMVDHIGKAYTALLKPPEAAPAVDGESD
ncbi:MAG: NAD(P)H-hydrate dehydratase [Flavobacteriaceae bacterium]|nr:NAD(P)H-hydrate dehydratase [Flavobacteriaceae bacterium]